MDLQRWGFEPEATVVITGAGSGIGRATAQHCAQLGLTLALWDVDADAAQQVAGETAAEGVRTFTHTVDVFDASAVARAFAATVDALGPLRHLVNNTDYGLPPTPATPPPKRSRTASFPRHDD